MARLAGIPKPLLARASTVLQTLDEEGDKVREALVAARDRQQPGMRQKELFAPPPDSILEELQQLDLDGLSQRQALDLLRQWQERRNGE